MELSFIISAVRRRLWLIVLFTIVGAVVGSQISSSSSENDEFEARSALFVQPPASTGTVISNEPDRYVLGQQRVLEGLALAQQVAGQMPGETADSVRQDVSIVHNVSTDILEIVVRSEDPERAQTIANLYATTYIDNQTSNAASGTAPGVTQFEAEIATLTEQIDELSEQLNQIRINQQNTDPDVAPIGDVGIEGQIAFLSSQRAELQRQLIEAKASTFARVTSQVVETAVLPTATLATSSRLYLFAGLLGGFALGVVAAIFAARLSPKVLDRYEAETVLNQPMTGELVHAGGLGRSRAAALHELPSALEQVVSRICARAQANAVDDRQLVIAVVGTQRGAGTTTLALAMAGRFARTDLNSVVVDFDSHDPELTRLFARGTGGIPVALSYLGQASDNGAPMSSHNRARRIDPSTIFASTPSERVRIIGAGTDGESMALRRSEITRLLDFAARDVDVVIADAGSLPDAAAAEQLVRVADCVVVAVPLKRLRASTLDTTARLLSGRNELILPVITHPGRSRFARKKAAVTPAARAPEADND